MSDGRSQRKVRLRAVEGSVPPSAHYRSDPDVHREQVRATNRARARATRILVLAHTEEFMVYYRLAGAETEPPVTPKYVKARTAEDIHMQVAGEVAWMQGRLERLLVMLAEAQLLAEEASGE